MNVIVAGSRTFDDYRLLRYKLDQILANKLPDVVIVSGGARGADTLGERYAQERGLPVKQFPADWDTYGKRAGYLRNEEMAGYADALVAFWDGSSNGTRHMIDLMQGKPVRVIRFSNGTDAGSTTSKGERP